MIAFNYLYLCLFLQRNKYYFNCQITVYYGIIKGIIEDQFILRISVIKNTKLPIVNFSFTTD